MTNLLTYTLHLAVTFAIKDASKKDVSSACGKVSLTCKRV